MVIREILPWNMDQKGPTDMNLSPSLSVKGTSSWAVQLTQSDGKAAMHAFITPSVLSPSVCRTLWVL